MGASLSDECKTAFKDFRVMDYFLTCDDDDIGLVLFSNNDISSCYDDDIAEAVYITNIATTS